MKTWSKYTESFLFFIREIYKVYYEKKDNQFYYVIKHSQVECTQKALIFIYGPGKRTEVWRKWEDYGLSLFLFAKFTCCIMRERLGKYKNLIENSKDDWRNEDVSFVRTRDQRTERCCLYVYWVKSIDCTSV